VSQSLLIPTDAKISDGDEFAQRAELNKIIRMIKSFFIFPPISTYFLIKK
jgi:hypothetical protein